MSNSNRKFFLLFGLEGMFFMFATSMNGYGNALYATNMGATDSQIGLIQLVPNLVAFFALLPLGIISDRLKSSKTIPLISLLFMSLGYFLFGTVPAMGSMRMMFYFMFLAFTAGGAAIYNGQWQAMFGDLTAPELRNDVYSLRNRFMFVIGVITPLIAGYFMNMQDNSDSKLLILRIFFYICGSLSLIQAFTLLKIPGGKRTAEELSKIAKFRPKVIAETIKVTMTDKNFLVFFIPVLLFYICWHIDWSMWYIGQTQYCMMNESQLSVSNAGANIAQLIAVGFIAKLVHTKSADFTILTGAFCMAMMPIIMISSSIMPLAFRPYSMIILIFIFNLPAGSIALCAVQLLLSAAPKTNRALVVSLYTMCITISNSFVPWLGVKIYEALGSNFAGLLKFESLVLVLRTTALLVLIWRFRYAKKRNILTVG